VDEVICGQLDPGCSRSEILSTLYRTASLFEFLMLRHGIAAIHADFTGSDTILLGLYVRIGADSVLF